MYVWYHHKWKDVAGLLLSTNTGVRVATSCCGKMERAKAVDSKGRPKLNKLTVAEEARRDADFGVMDSFLHTLAATTASSKGQGRS